MSRYYFYHANYFIGPKPPNEPAQQGELHGIWVVDDDSTPDVILGAIESWLYEDWEKRAQAASDASTVNFVITQFNSVQ